MSWAVESTSTVAAGTEPAARTTNRLLEIAHKQRAQQRPGRRQQQAMPIRR